MWKVDKQGWISVNKHIINLSLVEYFQLGNNDKTIFICCNSSDVIRFDYDDEKSAKYEFERIKKAMGFE